MSLTFLTDHTPARMHALDEQIVRGWNRQRPDVPVTLMVLDPADLKDRLEQYLTSERPPDVITFHGSRMRSLGGRGLMLDIAGLWEPGGPTESYAPRFRRMAGENGAAYFLPTSHYWWAVYYRPSIFQSVGIATPIETWADLTAAAGALQAAGIVPFALGARYQCPAAAWFDYLNLRINGPRFHHDLMSLRESYLDERVRAVFTFWQRLLDQGWFLGSPAEYDEEEAVNAVMRGAAGMMLIGSYVSDEYVADGEPDLGCFRFPLIDPALLVGEDAPVDGYFVAGRSRAPDQAVAFLAHLASREVQQQTIEATNVLPTRTDVDINRGGPHVPQGMDILRRADQLSQFYDQETPWQLAGAGMQAFVSFLQDPGQVNQLLGNLDGLRTQLRER